MEITSQQQYLATSRGVETTRPSTTYFAPATPPKSSEQIGAEEEQSAAQKREEQRYEQAVKQQLRELQSRDREVRAHEAAHVAAGGRYVTGGPSFTYQRGPNGRFYAIGGEVNIDVSAIPSNPQATLEKAETVRRAALAPAQPSPQDLRVAANATRLASRARLDIAIQQREQLQAQQQSNNDEGNSGIASSRETVSGFSGYASTGLAEPAREVFDIVA